MAPLHLDGLDNFDVVEKKEGSTTPDADIFCYRWGMIIAEVHFFVQFYSPDKL